MLVLTMSIPVVVTKPGRSLVRPSEATPSGELPLSPFDKNPAMRRMFELLFVYKKGREPAKAIKGALSQALVPYYPMAGRLLQDDSDDLRVACTAEGVWFVEATANCTLQDVGHLHEWPLLSKEQFLPYPRPSIDPVDALLMIQVTEFTCGGFAVGIIFNHVMMDGIGLTQFLQAVGDLASGGISSAEPVWCRDSIPIPAPCSQGSNKMTLPAKLSVEHLKLDVCLGYINNLRKRFSEETGQACSIFDAVAAKVWQSRSRARAATGDQHLFFPANIRHLLRKSSSISGRGYYGNGIHSVSVTAPSAHIMHASLVDIMKLIQEAKQKLPAEFRRWADGEVTNQILGDDSLALSDWMRLLEIDYGWGKPVHVRPVTVADFIAMCVIVRPPEPGLAARLLTSCVGKEHLGAFQDEMMDALP